MLIKFSGEHLSGEKLEVTFNTKGEKWIEIDPQNDSTGNYLNINLKGESIWIKEETLKIEIVG